MASPIGRRGILPRRACRRRDPAPGLLRPDGRGRQLGCVLATRYGEVVVDQVFPGNVQLRTALQPLVEAAEVTLQLDEAKRARTIIRVDAGAGTIDDLNWLLEHHCEIVAKDYAGKRVVRLANTVTE